MKKAVIILLVALCGVTFTGMNAVAQSSDSENVPASIATTTPSLKSGTGQIELKATTDKPTTFFIYSITGQLMKRVNVTSGTATVELQRGYYIVKCEKWSKQAVVK